MSEIKKMYGYKLRTLRTNKKVLIDQLGAVAQANLENAQFIVDAIEEHIFKISPEAMLPALYLIDSIVKNIGGQYLTLFSLSIMEIFFNVYEQVTIDIRQKMYHLRKTWTTKNIFSESKLCALDVQLNSIDPDWPLAAPITPSKAQDLNRLQRHKRELESKLGYITKRLAKLNDQTEPVLKKRKFEDDKSNGVAAPEQVSEPILEQANVEDEKCSDDAADDQINESVLKEIVENVNLCCVASNEQTVPFSEIEYVNDSDEQIHESINVENENSISVDENSHSRMPELLFSKMQVNGDKLIFGDAASQEQIPGLGFATIIVKDDKSLFGSCVSRINTKLSSTPTANIISQPVVQKMDFKKSVADRPICHINEIYPVRIKKEYDDDPFDDIGILTDPSITEALHIENTNEPQQTTKENQETTRSVPTTSMVTTVDGNIEFQDNSPPTKNLKKIKLNVKSQTVTETVRRTQQNIYKKAEAKKKIYVKTDEFSGLCSIM